MDKVKQPMLSYYKQMKNSTGTANMVLSYKLIAYGLCQLIFLFGFALSNLGIIQISGKINKEKKHANV